MIRPSKAALISATASSTPVGGLRASISKRVTTTQGRDGLVRRHQATWGPATFDFGVIYYTYPGEGPITPVDYPQLNYVELKAGVSGTIHEKLALGGYIFWSPDYFAETGSVWTFEGQAGYTFHQIGVFTPTINGVVGYQTGGDSYDLWNGFGEYWYWNAGLALAVDKLIFDFR